MEINYEYLNTLINWRNSLIEGRTKPDRTGNHPYVRESGEYAPTIIILDEIIKHELDIDNKFKAVRAEVREESKTADKFFKSMPFESNKSEI